MADSSKIKMSTDLPIDSSSSSSNSPSTHHPSQNDKLNDEIVKKLQNQSLFGDSEVKPEQVEDEHVHKVYDEIANHFSSTRYKGWPRIVNWLGNRGDNVLGIDIGCGNGKYLFYTRNTYAGLQKIHEESNESKLNAKVPSLSNSFMVGCDRSVGLVSICGERKLPVFVANGLDIPCRGGIFDYAISIAVIHHMSTRARRIEAIKEMIRVLSPKGQGLIYVWALEQEGKKFEVQDNFVPWHLQPEFSKKEEKKETVVYQRFYHVFIKGELEELVLEAGGAIIKESGYDRDNWFVILEKL